RYGRQRRHAGDDLDVDAVRGEMQRLLAAAAEEEGVAALEPDDGEAAPGEPDEQRVDLVLGERLARDAERPGRRLVDQLARDQPVVDERVAGAKERETPNRDQPRVARAGADERDRAAHRASASSTSRRK